MGKRGSKIATYIDNDYKKEKEWKERAERIKQMSQNRFIILGEHSRNPIIMKEREL